MTEYMCVSTPWNYSELNPVGWMKSDYYKFFFIFYLAALSPRENIDDLLNRLEDQDNLIQEQERVGIPWS